jgi:hypothetical protein
MVEVKSKKILICMIEHFFYYYLFVKLDVSRFNLLKLKKVYFANLQRKNI